MKKNILILTAVLVFMVNYGYSQWIQETAPITTYGTGSLYSIWAINAMDVAAVGDGRLITTCDGGNTWTDAENLGGWEFYSVHTMDTTSWYGICSNVDYIIAPQNPCGGASFYGSIANIIPNGIHFRTPLDATVVGNSGQIRNTHDRCSTWDSVGSGTTFKLESVWYADTSVGVAVGLSAALTRTTDGGAHWTLNQNIPTFFSLYSVMFPTPTTGYVCGALGTFLKTTDAGVTWNAMTTNTATFLNGVYFLDSLNGYVVGDSGKIMKTTDGALTWSTMASGTLKNLWSVNFINPDIGWIVGDDSVILKLDLTTGTVAPTNGMKNASIAPNPSENITTLSLDCSKAMLTTVKLNDITGRTIETVFENTLSSGHHDIPIAISSLSRGIYFINVTNESGSSVLKLVKE